MRVLSVTRKATIRRLAFSPDGRRLAVWPSGSDIRLVEVATGTRAILKGTGGCDFLAFAKPGLVTGSGTSVRLWDSVILQPQPVDDEDRTIGYGACLTADGSRLVSVFPRSRGWQITCRELKPGRSPPQHFFLPITAGQTWGRRNCLACDRSDNLTLVLNGRARFFSMTCAAELGEFDLRLPTPIELSLIAGVVSSDHRWLAIRGTGGVQVFDLEQREPAFGPVAVVASALMFSPDGRLLLTADESGDIHPREVGTWREGATLNFGVGQVGSLAFSADGMLAAAGGAGKVAVWDWS